MLTNKKIGVLIILITFFLTSCGITNVEKSDENKETKIKIEKNNGEGKKGKSIGGEALNINIENSIYNGTIEYPKGSPKNIK